MNFGCSDKIIGNSSSSGGSIITNNYFYEQSHFSSQNWGVFNKELTFTTSTSYTITSLPGLLLNSSGKVTLSFYLPVIFQKAFIYNASGINNAVFKDENGNVLKTLNFVGTGNLTLTDNILCSFIEFNLQNNVVLGEIIWKVEDPIEVLDPINYTNKVNFNIISSNSYCNGTIFTKILPGNMKFYFLNETILYKAIFTGKIYLYDYNGTKVYEGSSLNYGEKIYYAEFDDTLSLLVFRQQKKEKLNEKIEDFTSFDENYTNVEKLDFSAVGKISTNLLLSKKTLINNGGTLSLNFKEEVLISLITFISNVSSTIEVLGKDNFVIDLSDEGLQTYNIVFSCKTLIFSSQVIISQINYTSSFNQNLNNIDQFQVYDFSSYNSGEINILNNFFQISSSDMINFPSMILDSSGEKSVCYSSDADPNNVNPGSGTLNIVFEKRVYLKSMEFLNSSGTINISGKVYNINNKVYFNDFSNKNCFLCDSLIINLDGSVKNLEFSLNQIKESEDYYKKDNFLTNVDLNIPSPEIVISSDNLLFDNLYFLENLTITMHNSGSYVEFYKNNILLKTFYIPFYGNNIDYLCNINFVVDKIIKYNVDYKSLNFYTKKREIIGLLDNSNSPVNLTTNLLGNYNLSIKSFNEGAFSQISLTKGGQTNIPFISSFKSISSSGESVEAEWDNNSPIKIYHYTTKSGGTGDYIYYFVYY